MRKTLADRHTEHTRQLILEAALVVLKRASVGELTVRSVAIEAHISERTVFRYFATREEFLDAVAEAVARQLDLPAVPTTMDELLIYPHALYTRYEAMSALTKAALHSELFPRIQSAHPRQRWIAVRKLVDECAPTRSPQVREMVAANIRFFLAATAWNYYRTYFGFNLKDSIACAELSIRQSIDGLREGKR
jgi:AcrR family transcriptional regulator